MSTALALLYAAVARAVRMASGALVGCALYALSALLAAELSSATVPACTLVSDATVLLVSSEMIATAPTCRYWLLVKMKKRKRGRKSGCMDEGECDAAASAPVYKP